MQVEGSNSFSMVSNYCTEIGCYSRVQGLLHKTKMIINEFKQAFTILNLFISNNGIDILDTEAFMDLYLCKGILDTNKEYKVM